MTYRTRFSTNYTPVPGDGCTSKQHDLIVRIVSEVETAEATITPETAAAAQTLIDSITDLPALLSDGWAGVDRRATSAAIDALLAVQRLVKADRNVVAQPRRNAYADTCAVCGEHVPAQAGLLLGERGSYSVRHDGPCPTPAPAVDLPLGLHQHPDGRIVKVYLTKNGRKAGKVLVGSSFRYQQGAVSGLSVDTVMTAEQAKKYGRTTGHCCNCGDDIGHGDTVSTLISLAQGYGPVCAKRNSWPTLTADAAIDLLLAEGIDHPLLAPYK